jgi:hypothetical protein
LRGTHTNETKRHRGFRKEVPDLPFGGSDGCRAPESAIESQIVNIACTGFWASRRGFVPDAGKVRCFVINQIGGFVFEKALSYQPS